MAKRSRVTQVDWDRYANIVKDFVDVDAGRQVIYWMKKVNVPAMFGEDIGLLYNPIKMEGLFQYNFVRAWPMNKQTVSGELEGENQALYVTVRQIDELGHLKRSLSNPIGYWDMNWSEDRFIINGKVYKPDGDTQVAQAKDIPLLFFVVLRRDDPTEGDRLLKILEDSLET